MTTVHIMTGLPGSGKTSHARTLNALRFNLDDYRAMMSRGEWKDGDEAVAIEAMIASATAAIKAGQDIVLDNTHLTRRLPDLYKKRFSPLGVTFVVHDLTGVPVEDCIERDAARGAPVGKDVIKMFARRHAGATKNGWRLEDSQMNYTSYQLPEKFVPDYRLPAVVLCDIDGTAALNKSGRSPFAWDRVDEDSANGPVIHLVNMINDTEWCRVIFFSGRDEVCRDKTVSWLDKYVYDFDPNAPISLFMRPKGDMRPDYVVKSELFEKHIRGKFNVIAVLDDRDQVVKLWRDMGLTCLQVAEGNF